MDFSSQNHWECRENGLYGWASKDHIQSWPPKIHATTVSSRTRLPLPRSETNKSTAIIAVASPGIAKCFYLGKLYSAGWPPHLSVHFSSSTSSPNMLQKVMVLFYFLG